MRIAYFDCASGISGDMTLGALVDAGADLAAINDGVASLGLPGVRIVAQLVKKKGFCATQINIEHEPEHKHRHLHHITAMIDAGRLTERQKDLAKKIFARIGAAEAKVHGTTIEQVHFHEVGAVDSIADIVGAAIGWDLLGIERAYASSVPTGGGFIEIAHGRCSVPAPATAELLAGIPIAPSSVQHELTTPTGAAILATLVGQYGPLPAMKIERIGYGAGQRDLEEQPNLLRLLVGEAAEVASAAAAETIWVLETNLDDASGQTIGHALGQLLAAGALDAYTTAIGMKKNRPAVQLSVLCHGPDVDRMEAILFRETTTLGVRRWSAGRTALARRRVEVSTPLGDIGGMVARLPGGSERFMPEYDECARIAEKAGASLRDVQAAAQDAWRRMAS